MTTAYANLAMATNEFRIVGTESNSGKIKLGFCRMLEISTEAHSGYSSAPPNSACN
jgi:hypothetical protein